VSILVTCSWKGWPDLVFPALSISSGPSVFPALRPPAPLSQNGSALGYQDLL
jgi:hypothetical protein